MAHLPFGKSCPTRRIVATFHDTSPFPMILLPVKEIPKFMISFCTWNRKKRLYNWWFGARVVWIPNGSPYKRDCYLEVTRFDSQTTGPQTTIVALEKALSVDYPSPNFPSSLGECCCLANLWLAGAWKGAKELVVPKIPP